VARILLTAAAEDPELVSKINAAYDRILLLKGKLTGLPEKTPAPAATLEAWLLEIRPDPDHCTLTVVQ